MSFNRRTFVAAAAAFGGYAAVARAQARSGETYVNQVPGYGPLVKDPYGILDLPEGFAYRVVSKFGEVMSDGLEVPYKADGMGCFPLGGSRVALVRNHELKPEDKNWGAAGFQRARAGRIDVSKAFDTDANGFALPGGTTTLVYDIAEGRLVEQWASLVGTAVNCAGGVTPWGSWLTCEETVLKAGDGGLKHDHGWVFEVPAAHRGLADPVPLKAMGRFKHEAAAVDPRTGIVYLTEDDSSDHSLFYRFLPAAKGELTKGGRLQALAFRDAPSGGDSRNWTEKAWSQGDWKEVFWVDLDSPEAPDGDLRHRGAAKGAAKFARGEGMHFGEGELFFTCTSGGAKKHGQLMRYVPSPREGTSGERREPGRIQLFLESADDKIYDYGDNLTVAPWGHLFVCEDRYSDVNRNHLRGVTPNGQVYAFARNVFRDNAELAGVCFSPDGSTMFLNVYWPGITVAITGPWASLRTA